MVGGIGSQGLFTTFHLHPFTWFIYDFSSQFPEYSMANKNSSFWKSISSGSVQLGLPDYSYYIYIVVTIIVIIIVIIHIDLLLLLLLLLFSLIVQSDNIHSNIHILIYPHYP